MGWISSAALQEWKVGNDPVPFNTAAGSQKTVDIQKMFDGGRNTPDLVVPAKAMRENITLTRSMKPTRSSTNQLRVYDRLVGKEVVLHQHWLDENRTVIDTMTYTAALQSCKHPDYDENGNDAAMMEVEFVVTHRIA